MNRKERVKFARWILIIMHTHVSFNTYIYTTIQRTLQTFFDVDIEPPR